VITSTEEEASRLSCLLLLIIRSSYCGCFDDYSYAGDLLPGDPSFLRSIWEALWVSL